jgi:hypothetical protein
MTTTILATISTVAAAVSAFCALRAVIATTTTHEEARREAARDRHRHKIDALVAAIESMNEASASAGHEFEIGRARLRAALAMPPRLELPATTDLAGVDPPPYSINDRRFWDALEVALGEVAEASHAD